MRTTIGVLHKNGVNSTPAVVKTLESLRFEDCCYVLATPSAIFEIDDVNKLREKNLCSPVVIGCVFSKSIAYRPQIARIENATLMFDGRFYPFAPGISPTTTLAQRLQIERESDIGKLLEETEGDFSLTVAEPSRILATRDPIGVQPFYYGENVDFAALASNRKVLWKLGIEETNSFPPGKLAIVSKDGFEFKPFRTLTPSTPKKITLEQAAKTLQNLIEHSIRVRVSDVKEVAVAFSGGLDSSVIAFLAKKCGINVRLVHVSMRNQPETEEAKKAADELKLPLSCYLFENEDVEKTVPKVVELIEDADPVKVAVGIPFYWVAEKTAESGLRVLLAGQGADELFGGYQRYVNEYLYHGAKKVRESMFADVTRLHESNIERDEKICSFHDVDLRLPFASFQIAEFALSLPLELKIEPKADGLRKLVLRKLAKNIGLPAAVVEKPKKAVQYSTGVNSVLGKVAKKHGSTINEYVKNIVCRTEENCQIKKTRML
jgi:asparagine synthase (glutamine-hydrolysing)